jgi:hypothetical protein
MPPFPFLGLSHQPAFLTVYTLIAKLIETIKDVHYVNRVIM